MEKERIITLAYEVYPDLTGSQDEKGNTIQYDILQNQRIGFVKGYEMALAAKADAEEETKKDRGGGNKVRIALDKIKEAGYRPRWNPEKKSITFIYFGNIITYFPKKEYFNGKGVRPGFGLENLLDQI